MRKPIHEQEWRVRKTNIGPIIDDMSGHPEGEAVCMVYAPMSYDGRRLTLAQSDAIREARAAFISAAPNMARTLLRLYRAFPKAHATEEEADAHNEARELLLKLEMLP